MAQSTILGRISQLVRANVNALIDQAEDPELMLDQLVRDYTDNISEAEQAVAQTIGNLRLLEDDLREAREAQDEWGEKALAASDRAEELRGAGNTTEAERFDQLARIALRRQLSFEEQVRTFEPQVATQQELVDKLTGGLETMRSKREELVSKRDELIARARMARAQSQVQTSVKEVSILDPTSELRRFEDRVRREEAMARGQAEVASSSLEAQFEALEDSAQDAEVEERLRAMKSRSEIGAAAG
jgi:phage shock protein A